MQDFYIIMKKVKESQEWFYQCKLSRPSTVVIIKKYHVSTIAAAIKGRCKFKENECLDEMNQSETDAFEIIAT